MKCGSGAFKGQQTDTCLHSAPLPLLPPLLQLLGGLFEPSGVNTYPVKKQGANLCVQVDVNAKLAFEQQYWSGVLDAQGKANGKYY